MIIFHNKHPIWKKKKWEVINYRFGTPQREVFHLCSKLTREQIEGSNSVVILEKDVMVCPYCEERLPAMLELAYHIL
jgi:hypothetical protein